MGGSDQKHLALFSGGMTLEIQKTSMTGRAHIGVSVESVRRGGAAAVRCTTCFPNLQAAAAWGTGGAALDCIFSLDSIVYFSHK
jgi:hypothetical protein